MSFRSKQWAWILITVYALAVTTFGVLRLDNGSPTSAVTLMGSRQALLQDSIRSIEHGGPPLTATQERLRDGQHVSEKTLFASNQGDDEGIYFYLPVMAKVLGNNDPKWLLKWLFIALMALVLFAYPFIFYGLFSSFAAAVIAPLFVLYKTPHLFQSDIYWISAWVLLLCVPALALIATRPWTRRCLYALLVIVAVAGLASPIRSHAGTPILLAGLILAIAKPGHWRSRTFTALVVILCYTATATVLFDGIRAYRDSHVGTANFAGSLPSAHPFWHPAFLGLSYVPNKYGIVWDDSFAMHTAQKVDPKVAYLSDEYESILRHKYFVILKNDPGFIVNTYWQKFKRLLRVPLSKYWLLLGLLPITAFGLRDRRVRWWMLLTLPALVLTLAPPMIAMPIGYGYEIGWISVFALLSLVALASAAGSLELLAVKRVQNSLSPAAGSVASRTGATFTIPRRLRLAVMLSVFTLIAELALIAVLPTQPPGESATVFYQQNATPLTPIPRGGTKIKTWSFSSGLPTSWKGLTGVGVRNGSGGLSVSTTSARFGYQLLGPVIPLRAGTYLAAVQGRPVDGGLYIGALDVNNNKWLSTSDYWAGEGALRSRPMTLRFSVAKPMQIQLILSNWEASDRSSTWALRAVNLTRLGP